MSSRLHRTDRVSTPHKTLLRSKSVKVRVGIDPLGAVDASGEQLGETERPPKMHAGPYQTRFMLTEAPENVVNILPCNRTLSATLFVSAVARLSA